MTQTNFNSDDRSPPSRNAHSREPSAVYGVAARYSAEASRWNRLGVPRHSELGRDIAIEVEKIADVISMRRA